MRRLMAISAFALFLAVPLWAQHGGGGHGGLAAGMLAASVDTLHSAVVTLVAEVSLAACVRAPGSLAELLLRRALTRFLAIPICMTDFAAIALASTTAFAATDSATTATATRVAVATAIRGRYGGYYDPVVVGFGFFLRRRLRA